MSHHKHPGAMPTSMKDKRVHFGVPGDVKRKHGGDGPSGTIVDEVWVLGEEDNAETSGGLPSWGRYCFFSQHIKWDNGKRTIRLGYYRRRDGETWWSFGSQTTVNAAPATIRELLTRTLAKKAWYR